MLIIVPQFLLWIAVIFNPCSCRGVFTLGFRRSKAAHASSEVPMASKGKRPELSVEGKWRRGEARDTVSRGQGRLYELCQSFTRRNFAPLALVNPPTADCPLCPRVITSGKKRRTPWLGISTPSLPPLEARPSGGPLLSSPSHPHVCVPRQFNTHRSNWIGAVAILPRAFDLAAGATAFLFHRPPGQLCPSSRELKCRFISAAEPSATRPSPQHLDPALWCSISKPNRSLDSAQSYLLPSGVLLSQHRRQRPRLLSDPIFAQYRIEDEINDDFGVFPCSGDTGVYRMRLQLDPSVLASQQIGVIESRTAATLKLRCRKTVPGVTPRVIDARPSTSSSPDRWYKVLIA
ncbi:hypothetical protein FA95DRAFT_1231395 [Auriscalpium vulgare]|uniref:Uncharacterized protein n=1 Tax=Auriscalpium vulgare TaxID=40419 RepID=A0ACB8RTA1_9AGAM|nr:hypothetical protein FA95DRAFT_1231395 [Auriscalpium vulgare]